MAEQEEVLKYKLDVTEVQAKMQVLERMLQQLRAKKAAGEDTGELENQIGKEVAGLTQLSQKQKQAGNAAEDLVRQKEKLSNVVSLLGGQFGGMVGQLGNVIELLMQAGPAAAGFAGALAAVTALTIAYKKLQEEIEAAIQKEREFQEQHLSIAEKVFQRRSAIETELEKIGAATPQAAQEAAEMGLQIREEFGYEVPPEALARAAKEGIKKPEEVGVLGMAIEAGADIEGAGGGAPFIQGMVRAGGYERARAGLLQKPLLEKGRLVSQVAAEERGQYSTDLRPQELMFMAKREAGTLPPDVTGIQEFMEANRWSTDLRQGEEARVRREQRAEEAAAASPPSGDPVMAQVVAALNKQIALLEQLAAKDYDVSRMAIGTVNVNGGGYKPLLGMKTPGGRMGPSKSSPKAPLPG